MVSDAVYELCAPVLKDESITEEDKPDHLEDLIKKELSLTGKALEDAVLGVLWRHRGNEGSTSPPPIRTTVIRRPSPAPWQINVNRSGTPVSSSPRSASGTINPPPGFGIAPPSFKRAKSSTASPSPRASPRLAYVTPQIPHSPSLSAYQFSEPSPTMENYGDLGSDNVDWLVNDDASSTTSWGDSGFNTGSSEYMQPVNVDMSPFDIIRSVLRDDKSDDELNKLLENNGYDLNQTIQSLMEARGQTEQPQQQEQSRTFLVGKSMSPTSRPITPIGQAKSPIVCRYFLASGHCARADCRFSHDLTNHLCKYWMQGNCLAGDSCMFSHDPSLAVAKLSVDSAQSQQGQSEYVQDYDSFPSLQRSTSNPFEAVESPPVGSPQSTSSVLAQSAMNPFANFVPSGLRSRPDSRPTSRHTSRAATPSALSFQDDDAFPSLGSAASNRPAKRHHGKRGHGHATHRENQPMNPSSMADVVKMNPTPSAPTPMLQTRRGLRPVKSFTGSRETSAAAQAIPPPEHIPWLETGVEANRAYLKARAEAFKHGSLRNKFLQGAAQAWNRNDTRGAKVLSGKGQTENQLMKEAHREAARILYDERNKHQSSGKELYVDLHGLHPEEAVSYLNDCLLEHRSSSRPLYAICGTGHHSKNGKDKIGKAVRAYLNEWRYAFREFSVPGDRNNLGGIVGIDPSSYDPDLVRKSKGGASSEADSGVGIITPAGEDTKVRIMTAEEARAQKEAEVS
ncbi:Hypothetical protein D9617_2g057050 [Elsinoe fawcettii]|nr:Hypothetical protein D9617_2g057050 [Elsinoe fawcettii]